jgi:hypothetical protein
MFQGPTAPRHFIDTCLLALDGEGGAACALLLGGMVHAGLLLDLLVLPLGLNAGWLPLRALAAAAAISFHLCNHLLFVIETFPFVMIAGTALFFDHKWIYFVHGVLHRRVFSHGLYSRFVESRRRAASLVLGKVVPAAACVFLALHAAAPLQCALEAPGSGDLCFTRCAGGTIAQHCTALHCIHCTVLHCTVLHCTVCTAQHCAALHSMFCTVCSALFCTALYGMHLSRTGTPVYVRECKLFNAWKF